MGLLKAEVQCDNMDVHLLDILGAVCKEIRLRALHSQLFFAMAKRVDLAILYALTHNQPNPDAVTAE